MRYPASEKLEIIRIVEQSHQPIKRTLEQIGVSRPTFYRWYDLYRRFGEAGLEDKRSGTSNVWNRIPDTVRQLWANSSHHPGDSLTPQTQRPLCPVSKAHIYS